MDYVQTIISAHKVKVGMQCLKWQKLNMNLSQILTCTYSLKKVQRWNSLYFYGIIHLVRT